MDTTDLIFYSANLAFIVSHLYGWLLKWYYRPKTYEETFHDLFPAQRSVLAPSICCKYWSFRICFRLAMPMRFSMPMPSPCLSSRYRCW